MVKALAFLRRDFFIETSYRPSFFFQIFGIFFNVFTFYYIARLLGSNAAPFLTSYGGDYFAFILIGLAFSSYFSVGLTSFVNSLRQAQMTGTLEAMLMTPSSTTTIVSYSALWEYIMTSSRVLIYLALGAFGFGLDLSRANYVAAFVILFLAILVFSSLGILAAGVLLVSKRGDPITWVFNALFILLGGVYYPITILPEILQRIAELIPITYALRALRLALLQGASFRALLPDLIALSVFGIVLLPLSLLVFREAVTWAKRDGSLTHY